MDPCMQTVIIVVHLMIVLAMIGLVLLQRSEGGGLGMGGGGGFMSNRGTANVLTRATAILAGLFFATSLVLSILAGFERKPTSILNPVGAPAGQPSPDGPGRFSVPGGPAPAQPGPAAQPPAGPQVPRSQ
jgi:preprotein translocase subunit SecG